MNSIAASKNSNLEHPVSVPVENAPQPHDSFDGSLLSGTVGSFDEQSSAVNIFVYIYLDRPEVMSFLEGVDLLRFV